MNLFFVTIQAAEQFPGFLPLLLYFWCSVEIFFAFTWKSYFDRIWTVIVKGRLHGAKTESDNIPIGFLLLSFDVVTASLPASCVWKGMVLVSSKNA